MNRLARRMQTLAAIQIALVLVALILLGALFAFGVYIRALSHELRVTSASVVAALSETRLANAPAAGRAIASRLVRPETEVVVLDADSRVTVFYEHRNDAAPIELVRARGDLSGNPPVAGPLSQLVLGLATAFGLEQLHERAGALYLIIKSNDATVIATVRSALLPLAFAILAAIVCGWLIARALTRQALRPLGDVTAALERFASGDLTPQQIAADERQELSDLALAYNGAIDQMERAFAERDRADASMREFIADAGHQLRTPLTVVQGFISILRGAESQAERERILATMYQQSRAMGSLIDKLILLERWENPKIRRTSRSTSAYWSRILPACWPTPIRSGNHREQWRRDAGCDRSHRPRLYHQQSGGQRAEVYGRSRRRQRKERERRHCNRRRRSRTRHVPDRRCARLRPFLSRRTTERRGNRARTVDRQTRRRARTRFYRRYEYACGRFALSRALAAG